MSIRVGDNIIAGGGVPINKSGMSIFDFKWTDHLLNSPSWLRADTFSWQDGTVYELAYQHLIDDLTLESGKVLYGWGNNMFTESATPSVGDDVYISNAYGAGSEFYFINPSSNNSVEIVGTDYIKVADVASYQYRNTANDTENARVIVPRQSETIAGTTIYYFLAADGHKIVLPNQESNVGQIFLDTGVAWYYILDTTNTQFKLPRTQFGVVGVRGNVGDYVEAGLPNITGTIEHVLGDRTGISSANAFSGSASIGTNGNNRSWNDGVIWFPRTKVTFDASNSNSIYGSSTTVQSPATQMYLYFYVGEFTQTAIYNTAGITTEALNAKADLSMFQIVNALPANPDPNTIYFVISQ